MRKRGFFAALSAALLALSAVSCEKKLHVDEKPKTTSEQVTTAAEGEKGTEPAYINTSSSDLNSYITVKKSNPALWKVTEPNSGNELYMLGMVYFMTENTLPLPDYVMDAYRKSSAIAVEYDMSNMAQDADRMQEFYSHMVYSDGTDIKDHISAETYQKAKDYLSKYFFYNNMMDGYFASYWASQVTAVAVSNVRNITMETLDSRFVTMAKMENKAVISIADADSQLRAMDASTDELSDFMISDTIRRAEDIGGFTKNLWGMWASPSYSSIPAYSTCGVRTRSNLSNSLPMSKLLEISMARSPRKLKKITLSPSSTVPTGLPSCAMTKAGRSWSITPSSRR